MLLDTVLAGLQGGGWHHELAGYYHAVPFQGMGTQLNVFSLSPVLQYQNKLSLLGQASQGAPMSSLSKMPNHVVMNVTKRHTAADSAETLFESCSSCKKLDTTTRDCLYITPKSRLGKLLPEEPGKSEATLILNCKWLYRDHILACNPPCTCFAAQVVCLRSNMLG